MQFLVMDTVVFADKSGDHAIVDTSFFNSYESLLDNLHKTASADYIEKFKSWAGRGALFPLRIDTSSGIFDVIVNLDQTVI